MGKTKIPYSKRDLFGMGPQPWLRGRNLDCVAFPLGGLGTGCISLGGWGQLQDWEIRNRPDKGYSPANVFFTLKAQTGKSSPVVRVLQGPSGGTWVGDGHTAPRNPGSGLPHFRKVAFKGEYPVAQVLLEDDAVPLQVTLEAFNPFIPHDAKDSGIPAAILLYRFTNTTKRKVSAWVYGNHTNFVGDAETAVNEARADGGLTGLVASNADLPVDSPQFGSAALSTPAANAAVWPRWHGKTRVPCSKFWHTITESDDFPPKEEGASLTGTVAARFTVKPGETVTVPFLITWYFPTVEHWEKPACEEGCEGAKSPTWRNWYANQWKDAWDVARYVKERLERLHEETVRFRDALFASTLPTHVLDAVSSQISILKTPSVLRLEDGTFYGFEGCSNTRGCCPGSCTHVWNYAQALPYLFPELQRSMREADYTYSMADDGFIQFRMPLPLGTKPDFRFHPAADGQMGGVIQVYREWLVSGDTEWLRGIWPKTKKALEFAWKYWDADRDGLMEGMQHNTYDNEFYGPNTMMGSLYLGALRAAEEMANALGETAKAAEYRAVFEKGSRASDDELFNGEYYEQRVEPDAHKAWPEQYQKMAEKHGLDDKFTSWPGWQFGKGCLSDQLLGQWYAEMLGLGGLYNPKHVRKTLGAIFKHNWRGDLTDHPGLLRLYALNDEAGLLIGSWPKGERPGDAFWFADEVWSGIEYQVASHMIYEGMVKEGLAVVLGVRRRYDGVRRNPWNEFECGHHYVRSMAVYAVMLALSGFRYSGPEQAIAFAPRINADKFRCFYAVGSAWGVYSQRIKGSKAEVELEVSHGTLTLRRMTAQVDGGKVKKVAAKVAGKAVSGSASRDGSEIVVRFDEPVEIKAGEKLRVRLG